MRDQTSNRAASAPVISAFDPLGEEDKLDIPDRAPQRFCTAFSGVAGAAMV